MSINDSVLEPYAPRLSLKERLKERKEKAKSMLAFLFLDLFLGGFVVSIVLMATLGRPASTIDSIGSGGDAFLLIEVFWSDANRMIAPVLVHNSHSKIDPTTAPLNGEVLNIRGIATLWNASPARQSQHWPTYDRESGKVSFSHEPFTTAMMDGFFIDPKKTLKGSLPGAPAQRMNYGYVWLSEPCSGTWSFGLRQIDKTIDAKESDRMKIWVKVTWSGFSEDQEEQLAEKTLFFQGNPDKSESVIATIRTTNGKGFQTIYIPEPKGDVFAWCRNTP